MRTAKRNGLAALGLAALAAIFWLLRPGSLTARAERPSSSAQAPPTTTFAEIEPPIATEFDERRALDGPTTDARADASREVRITFVDATDSQPVAHARVVVAKPGISSRVWENARARFGSHAAALEHGFGDEHEADEHGQLALPIFAAATRVCASSGALFGWRLVDAGAMQCVIELRHTRSLEVEVVDTTGAVVPNVCFELTAVADNGRQNVWSAWTDAAGRARAFDLDFLRREDNTRWRIGPAFGATTPEFIDLDESASTWERDVAKPLRFALGPTGDVELALLDTAGRPLSIDAQLALAIDRKRMTMGGMDGDWHFFGTNDGRARFEHVALDVPLWAMATAAGFEFDADDELRGPSVAGEAARIELRCRSVAPLVRGRILDANGQPFGRAHVYGCWPPKKAADFVGDGTPFFDAWTTSDGAFEAVLAEPDSRLELPEITLFARETNRAEAFVRVRVPPLKSPERAGCPQSYDFGTVTTEALPLLASGAVVDTDGRPISNARVFAYYPGTRADGVEVEFASACETDDDGRFVVCGITSTNSVELDAEQSDSGRSRRVRADRGSSDVRLVLPGRGRIAGSLLLPDGLTISDLDLDFSGVSNDPGSQAELNAHSYTIFEHDGFKTDVVDLGTWSVAILDGDAPIARREGLVLRAGQTLDVGPIDLRAAFRPATLAVVDERGMPVADVNVEFADAHGTKTGMRYLETGAPARVWLPSGAQRACVFANGFRTQTFEVRDDATWTLRAACSITLRWPGTMPPIDESLRLVISGEPEVDALCNRPMSAALDTSVADRVEVEASATGPWLLSYSIRRARSLDLYSPRLGEQRIAIADGDAPQVFTIEVDPAALVSAIAKARGE